MHKYVNCQQVLKKRDTVQNYSKYFSEYSIIKCFYGANVIFCADIHALTVFVLMQIDAFSFFKIFIKLFS